MLHVVDTVAQVPPRYRNAVDVLENGQLTPVTSKGKPRPKKTHSLTAQELLNARSHDGEVATTPAKGTVSASSSGTVGGLSAPFVVVLGVILLFLALRSLAGIIRNVVVLAAVGVALLGLAKLFPDAPGARQVRQFSERVKDEHGGLSEVVAKPFTAPVELIKRTKATIDKAQRAAEAKSEALEALTDDP